MSVAARCRTAWVPAMRKARAFQDAPPARPVGVLRHRLRAIEERRDHELGACVAGRRAQQQRGFGAERLRHAAGLAVGPDDPAMREVDPIPLEFEHLGHACGEVELQADRQSEERVLQAFRVRMIQIGVEASQLVVGDEAGALRAGIFLDVPARVRAVRPQTPELGEVEHLAHQRQAMIRGGRPIAQAADQVGDFGPLHVRDLHLAQRRQDVGLERDPVAPDGRRLVPRLRVLDS